MPFKSVLIIATCSAVSLMIAVINRPWLRKDFSIRIPQTGLGGFILIVLGLGIYQFFRPEKKKDVNNRKRQLLNFEIRSLGFSD